MSTPDRIAQAVAAATTDTDPLPERLADAPLPVRQHFAARAVVLGRDAVTLYAEERETAARLTAATREEAERADEARTIALQARGGAL